MPLRQDTTEVINASKPKKKRRVWLGILITFLAIILVATGGLYFYIRSLGIVFVDTKTNTKSDGVANLYADTDSDDEEKKETYGVITAMQSNAGLSDSLKSWYQNGGDRMASRNILNLLIVGIDASGGEAMTGNSDVMMLCSVDKKNKTITLCSFLRDSYIYYEVDGSGRYNKMNAAYAEGGAKSLIDAVEYNYKIDIDYFAAVDFEAFEHVVDAIGGITLTVTEEEAQAIENYAHITGVPYGENVNLTGQQALLFARMRKIYTTGDVQRTDNQRRVINAIISKAAANLSVANLSSVISTLAPYIYTDCPATKLMYYGTQAILGQWYNYERRSMEAPQETARTEPYDGDSWWVWIVDYPYAAQYVQTQVYGETNIVIPEGYQSAIDIYQYYGGLN